jgi:hypothetical protein
MFMLLSASPGLQRRFGGDTGAYVVVTILIALAATALVVGWATERPERLQTRLPKGGYYVWGFGIVAAALLVVAAREWIREILTIPIDPYRGDMLVVVREGLRRVFSGLNPYTIYHVPWAAPLPYGPMLWGPYALPMAMRVDLRFLTVSGALFVPAACAIASVVSAGRGRLAAAAAALAMLAAIALRGDVDLFVSVGHTPVYWPLIALFAWLVSRERWTASAVALGLLVVSRTTMIAIVPVLLMAVWMRGRSRIVPVCALLALAVALPFLPFAVWDPRALAYALYGSYETVIKTVVWPDPTVPHTIGLTGVLLTNHLNRWVEAVQLAMLVVVYVACWRLMRTGRAPIALMGLALLAFSMTTLWPVYYIYFDVFLLLAAGVLAGTPWLASRNSTPALTRAWLVTAAVVVGLVGGVGAAMLRTADLTPRIVGKGTKVAAPTSVLLLRRSASAAMVDIQVHTGSSIPQRVDVSLNGASLGAVETSGEHIMVAAPASFWLVGTNVLDLPPDSQLVIDRVSLRETR